MKRSSLWLACASLFAFSTPAHADEVVLHDGRILYGKVDERGATLVVATREGEVTVPRSDVLRMRSTKELEADLLGLASRCGKLSPFSCLHLACTARDWNLPEEMWSYLDRALAQGDIPDDVQERLEEFLGTLEPELLAPRWRKSTGPIKVREILRGLAANATAAHRAAAAHVLAGLKNVDDELRTSARAAREAPQRLVANEALWLRDSSEKARSFVLRSAIFDNAPEVRSRALGLAVEAGMTRPASDYLGAWLLHKHPKMSIRAADALAELGEPSAVETLVRTAPYAAAGGDIGVRAHAAFITQMSYIKDFDVEVAQASFIADPKVDALSYGSVLDVRVGAVITQRIHIVTAFRNAISKLEGADPGDDPSKWEAWLASRRNEGTR